MIKWREHPPPDHNNTPEGAHWMNVWRLLGVISKYETKLKSLNVNSHILVREDEWSAIDDMEDWVCHS